MNHIEIEHFYQYMRVHVLRTRVHKHIFADLYYSQLRGQNIHKINKHIIINIRLQLNEKMYSITKANEIEATNPYPYSICAD